MSAVKTALQEFCKLEIEDFQLMQIIENQIKDYEYVPHEAIKKQVNFSSSEIEFRFPILIKKGLVRGYKEKYDGYQLTTAGHDILAIKNLVKNDILLGFGRQLGVGKESDVYEAFNLDKKQVVVKFHRIGRTSFKKIKLKRNYILNYNYTPDWHIQSRISAKKEFNALQLLYSKGIAVPKPIKQNRHLLVMDFIEGRELFHFSELQNVLGIYNQIFNNVKRIYQEIKIIHGDLSPYNIILQPNQQIIIIDWPQNISITHPNAEKILKRDIKNILDFFKRKYCINNRLNDVMKYITLNSKSR
jgi:RIO kinase 2